VPQAALPLATIENALQRRRRTVTRAVTISLPKMKHPCRPFALVSSVLLAAACAPVSTPATPAPDRILAVDANGNVIRRSTADENARATIAAPIDKVWPALVLAYADLGIDPSIADRGAGRYGNGNFIAPRRINGRPLGEFYNCGSGLTGPYIENGRLTANVVTTLQPAPDGTTTLASTYASGTLRRNDGTSTDPIVCASTGALEETLRRAIERRLTGRL
jgi:hypothetical protein